jgi:hypothetical protein
METPILALRRGLLRKTQNADGGWGYYPDKQSWMEPTFYAIVALRGDPESAKAVDRAWSLLLSWQQRDGGWKPAAGIPESTWVTALGVTLFTIRGDLVRSDSKTRLKAGVEWLLRATGAESDLVARLKARMSRWARDVSNRGWPWRPDTTAWVEPTVHSLIALRRVAVYLGTTELRARIREGEDLLLTVRGRDGGWNYGSREALGVDLPSYPETTALALLGLQHRNISGIWMPEDRTYSRLADAWLSIASQVLGRAGSQAPAEPPRDLMIAALEAIGAPGGNAMLFRTEEG